jgi:hypothetical protein
MKPRYIVFSAALFLGIAVAMALGCLAADAAMTLQEKCRLGAWLAISVAREAPPLKVPSPDKPDQGDTCEECNGSGKLGDGTIMVTCGACGGTGRKKAAAFDTPASTEAFQAAELKQEAVDRAARLEAAAKAAKPTGPERYAVPPKGDRRTFRKVCRNGECMWEPLP